MERLRNVTVIDDNESRLIQRQNGQVSNNQNEGPFPIKTVTTAGARSVKDKKKNNDYCSECIQRNEMLDSIVISTGDSTQRFMSRDTYTGNCQYPDPRFCNFAIAQTEFNVREYAQGAKNLFDFTTISKQRQMRPKQ